MTLSGTNVHAILREAEDGAPMLASGAVRDRGALSLVCSEKEWAL